jgi:hypothetical protein
MNSGGFSACDDVRYVFERWILVERSGFYPAWPGMCGISEGLTLRKRLDTSGFSSFASVFFFYICSRLVSELGEGSSNFSCDGCGTANDPLLNLN